MGSPPSDRNTNIESICIIGAGPSGLAAAKYLLAERAFSSIKIYEQRGTVGGLWNYVNCPKSFSGDLPVPQTTPHAEYNKPIWETFIKDGNHLQAQRSPLFMTPVYDLLETNIPRGLMGFSDLDWPKDCQLFPRHEAVLQYLHRYALDILHLISFRTQVVDVFARHDGRWIVRTRNISPDTNEEFREGMFDAVLVASGHFDVPFIPSMPGIEAWNRAYPGSITHSKFYRRPETFANKKVVVVGNSASGVDIGAQIATICKKPLLLSQKSESFLQLGTSSSKLEKPQIVEYVAEGSQIRFADGSTECDVDAVVYCTGYFYSFPFLKSLDPAVVTSGEYVENLYQHVFYRPQPTLAFATLNQKIIPFPVAEAQSSVIARVWSGRLELPSISEMKCWEKDTLEETGGRRAFHVLKFAKDADYINMLHDWAMFADDRKDGCPELRKRRMSGSSVVGSSGQPINSTLGKEPPYWGEKEYWIRERFLAIKKAFQNFGEERSSKRTLEDVGFDFNEWKREKIEEAKRLS